jgi:(p)ppGpp synthase/HD superfamily hydrolase
MALLYAFRLHAEQRRKGGDIPYFGHLLGVASIVIEAGGNEDQVIAALLHDAVEDQGGEATKQEIERLFGATVAGIVSASSDDAPDTSERTKENWRERKERYLNSIPHKDEGALLVSLADKIYNARSVLADLRRHGPDVWTRFNHGQEQQLWYYRGLVIQFCAAAQGHPRLRTEVGELQRIVTELGCKAGAPIDFDGAVGPCPETSG